MSLERVMGSNRTTEIGPSLMRRSKAELEGEGEAGE